MLGVGDKAINIVYRDGQVEHDERSIFLALPETPVVIRLPKGRVAFHLLGKTHARAGLRRCVRFDHASLTNRVTVFIDHAGSFLSFALADACISRKPISRVKIGL
jgi:hypothetical protein